MTRDKSKGFAHEDRGNKRHEWATPAWVFEMLGLRFDLDPCHPLLSAGPIPVDNYVDSWYTEEDDGLKSPWPFGGNIFMNPPYNQQTPHWLRKLNEHGRGIALVFARTDTKWYRESALKADAILYLKTRIKFIDVNANKDEDKAKNGAGAGSMLLAWGEDNVAALYKLAELGDFRDLRLERFIKPYVAQPMDQDRRLVCFTKSEESV
jgi:phage N-6-adenine-methyltransferase